MSQPDEPAPEDNVPTPNEGGDTEPQRDGEPAGDVKLSLEDFDEDGKGILKGLNIDESNITSKESLAKLINQAKTAKDSAALSATEKKEAESRVADLQAKMDALQNPESTPKEEPVEGKPEDAPKEAPKGEPEKTTTSNPIDPFRLESILLTHSQKFENLVDKIEDNSIYQEYMEMTGDVTLSDYNKLNAFMTRASDYAAKDKKLAELEQPNSDDTPDATPDGKNADGTLTRARAEEIVGSGDKSHPDFEEAKKTIQGDGRQKF